MTRKSAPGTLIHCEYCGEDFSATYKRCPFCGEKPSENAAEIPPRARDDRDLGREQDKEPEDDYVFEGGDLFDEPEEAEEEPEERGGGRRLHRERGASGINWTRLVTFICSLIIIVAALVIVLDHVYPNVHGNQQTGSGSGDNTPPSQTESEEPSSKPTPSVAPSEPPVEPSGSPAVSEPPVSSGEPVTGGNLVGVSLNKAEFTLLAGEKDNSYTVKATLDPANWEGEVTWSTSNPSIIKLKDKGKVTEADGKVTWQCTVVNANTGKSVLRGTVTVQAGDQSASVTVFCRPGVVPENGMGTGVTGTITGVSTSLRVRSGPGTSYDKVGTLKAGAKITIVADAGNGWFEITFDGGSGFILGEYIKVS